MGELMQKDPSVGRVRLLTMKLTQAGKFRVEQIRIAAKKDTREAVVFAAIRALGKRHGIEVPQYTNDDIFALVRRGFARSNNVVPLKARNRAADIILPLMGESRWYDELKLKLKASTLADVVKIAMREYDKAHMGG